MGKVVDGFKPDKSDLAGWVLSLVALPRSCGHLAEKPLDLQVEMKVYGDRHDHRVEDQGRRGCERVHRCDAAVLRIDRRSVGAGADACRVPHV